MEEDDPLNPTFQPSLPGCTIREKVPSSGYASGQVAKQPNRDVERTWEVPAPFVPELPPSELREKVPSSGYGKVTAQTPKKEVRLLMSCINTLYSIITGACYQPHVQAGAAGGRASRQSAVVGIRQGHAQDCQEGEGARGAVPPTAAAQPDP